MKRIAVIILSAGKGTRLKAATSKPFVMIKKMPLVIRTIQSLQKLLSHASFFLASNASEISVVKKMLEQYDISNVQVIAGGAHRTDSLFNVLAKIEDAPFETIIVHDGARPFVDKNLITRLLAGLRASDCCIPVIPVRYTIKKADPPRLKTLERSTLVEVQTPQVFKASSLIKAYTILTRRKSDLSQIYDDAQLIEYTHGSITTVEGSPQNLKITYPIDVLIAEQILRTWSNKKKA